MNSLRAMACAPPASVLVSDRPLAKGRAILENGVSGTLLVRIEARIEAGLLLTYAEVTGPGSGGVGEGQSRLEI